MTTTNRPRRAPFRLHRALKAVLVPGVLVVVISFVIGGAGPVHAQRPAMDVPRTGAALAGTSLNDVKVGPAKKCAVGTHWSSKWAACVADWGHPPEPGTSGKAFSLTYPANLANVAFLSGGYLQLQWGNAHVDGYQYCIDETNNNSCDGNLWHNRSSTNSDGDVKVVLHRTYYWHVRTRPLQQRYANNGWYSFTVVDATTFDLDGTVLAGSGPGGLGGVTMTYAGGLASGSIITGAGGAYSIELPNGWTGTITPSLSGYTFTPASRTYAVPADFLLVDYTSTHP